ncbi:MAG: RHS repeat-associated core domain-containing protein [Acutalibacteraceae bacterium]
MRTQKTDNGDTTYYYYDSDKNLIGLTKGNNTLLFYYDSNGNVTSFKYNGSMYYYIKNLQGDVVEIRNENGISFVDYVYDAWGNIKTILGDPNLRNLNPFRYRGYIYDDESGLYYLQSRYYDPGKSLL